MLTVSEIVAKTEDVFDLFNHYLYADELIRPAITNKLLPEIEAWQKRPLAALSHRL
ncbi:MAG: hypothetical protein RR933_06030 [Oscillospiraceae bacterium]